MTKNYHYDIRTEDLGGKNRSLRIIVLYRKPAGGTETKGTRDFGRPEGQISQKKLKGFLDYCQVPYDEQVEIFRKLGVHFDYRPADIARNLADRALEAAGKVSDAVVEAARGVVRVNKQKHHGNQNKKRR